jgi:hypothetical protein
MGFQAILLRLSEQRCLVEEDIAAAEAALASSEQVSVICNVVMRAHSPDGLGSWTGAEAVREHASVPDVVIRDDGTHVVVFNDVTPGLLGETMRTDPERFWRQGLIGLGGMGMVEGDGAGFAEVDTLDLHLPLLQQVVDPDLARRPDGDWLVDFFGITPENLDDGQWDPFNSHVPHDFWRGRSSDTRDWPAPSVILATDYDEHGGADPTLLAMPDGGESLWLGDPFGSMPGWFSADGEDWDPAADPDVVTDLAASTPDAVADPAGGWRLYFRPNGMSRVDMARSTDGRTWTDATTVSTDSSISGVSVAVDPDGTWWMYYTVVDPDCVAAGGA